MSMTGKDPAKPTKVKEFVVIANWACNKHSVPNETLQVPIDGKSGTIERIKAKDRYVKVDTQLLQGSILYTYQVWGGQHRKDPRLWVGKARMHRSTEEYEGESVNDCDLDGADEAGAVSLESTVGQGLPRDLRVSLQRTESALDRSIASTGDPHVANTIRR
jgi:hypothetical protein